MASYNEEYFEGDHNYEPYFDEEGNFVPIGRSSGNVDGNTAHLRDTFLESEREYARALLSDPEIINFFRTKITDYSPSHLIEQAVEIQNQLESGQLETEEERKTMEKWQPEERDEFHMEKLEQAEKELILLFAAISDKVILKELKLHIHIDPEKIPQGRGMGGR